MAEQKLPNHGKLVSELIYGEKEPARKGGVKAIEEMTDDELEAVAERIINDG